MRLLFTLASALFAIPLTAQARRDEAQIRQLVADEMTAWNKGDAVAYSRDFAEHANFTNIQGQFFTGHDAFVSQHEFIFRGVFKGTTAQQEIVSLKFLTPNVAIVETLTSISNIANPAPGMALDAAGNLHSRLLQVLEKRSGRWRIVTYHNVAVNPRAPAPFNKE